VSEQQIALGGLSVESGILMNNGVPVVAGGMSVRGIQNPWWITLDGRVMWMIMTKVIQNDSKAHAGSKSE
jgi:hypothetical protein